MMSKAFTCDICGRYFSPEPEYGAHTTVSDNVPGHTPMDICHECSRSLIQFFNDLRKSYEQPENPESE